MAKFEQNTKSIYNKGILPILGTFSLCEILVSSESTFHSEWNGVINFVTSCSVVELLVHKNPASYSLVPHAYTHRDTNMGTPHSHTHCVFVLFHSTPDHVRARRQAISSPNTTSHQYNTTMPAVGWNTHFGETNISVDLHRGVYNSFEIRTGQRYACSLSLAHLLSFSLHPQTHSHPRTDSQSMTLLHSLLICY